MLNPGDCLLIETYTDEDGNVISHLFIIVLEAQDYTNNTIIVNLSSYDRGAKHDNTTILNAGDHDFIIRESYIVYRKARIRSMNELEELINSGKAQLREPLEENVFQKVCEGILKSSFTPSEVKEMYRENLFNKL